MRDPYQLLPTVDGSLKCQGVWSNRLRNPPPSLGPVRIVLSIQIFPCTADVLRRDSYKPLPGH